MAAVTTTGRDRHLRRQAGEHLVCAELARRGYLATPFAGNVPDFDLIAVNSNGNAVLVQVKAATKDGWLFDPSELMVISGDAQIGFRVEREREIENPDLVWVCVLLDFQETREGVRRRDDRFFVMRRSDFQRAIIQAYVAWLPNAKGTEKQYRYHARDIEQFEDNWGVLDNLGE